PCSRCRPATRRRRSGTGARSHVDGPFAEERAMSAQASPVTAAPRFVGNDRVLFGIIFGVLAFWLFAQTTLNIAPVMAQDLGIETSVMNIAVSITALFSGIFIVVVGSLADRFGRVKVVQAG